MAFIRRVKTASGATAVQIAYKKYGKITKIIHIGSAHNSQEEKLLLDVAHQRLHANQQSLFPDTPTAPSVQLKSSSSDLLRKVLMDQYHSLGFNQLSDDVFAWLTVAILNPNRFYRYYEFMRYWINDSSCPVKQRGNQSFNATF